MSDNSNIGAVQWKLVIDRCPQNIKKMLLQHIAELKIYLDSYPTAGMTLLTDKNNQNMIIPDVIRSCAQLRGKINELDMILENSINMLAGYASHLEAKSAQVVAQREHQASGDVELDKPLAEFFGEPAVNDNIG